MLRIEGHDLRSPLANIRSYAAMTLGRKGLDPRTQRALEIIVKNADRALGLIDEWVDARRAGSGALELNPSPTALGGLVRMALTDEQAALEEAGLRVRTEIDDDLPPFALDANRIRKAVRALLQAAMRRAPGGSEIRVRVRPDGDRVRVEVEDEGPPPSPEEVERAFDPEFQMLAARRMAAGLGMALCRASAEAHGGSAGLEKAPGGGAAHFLAFPFQRA